MTGNIADFIVVGLGALGSATAWQLSKRGAKVIAIDRFAPPHNRGSSHGQSRITRLATGEGDVYVPLVKRSHDIWAELQALRPGRSLYLRTGGIIIGPDGDAARLHGRSNFVGRTIEAAKRFDIAHDILKGDAILERFPQFVVQGDEIAYYEHEAGVLRPEACVVAQIEEAQRQGASIRFDERVLGIEGGATSGARLLTSRATYAAGQVILTAGAWTPQLAGTAFASRLTVMRQVLFWFETAQPALYGSPDFPIFIWKHGPRDGDEMYGFPSMDGETAVKLATEQFRDACVPDATDRRVAASECRAMFDDHVAGRLREVTSNCVRSSTCLYTVSPDFGFIVDSHADIENVTVVSACSGHGFKHSAAMGEELALRALGEPGHIDWQTFGLARFG